jgi:hypothetical protein
VSEARERWREARRAALAAVHAGDLALAGQLTREEVAAWRAMPLEERLAEHDRLGGRSEGPVQLTLGG